MGDNDNTSIENVPPSATANFEPEALSSRYSAEVEQEQQQQQQQQQQQEETLESNENPSGQVGSTKTPFDALDAFHNVDQSVNLMDVKEGNYAALEDDEDRGKQGKSKKPPATSKPEGGGSPSTFMGALLGEGGGGERDANKPSSGWSNVPKQEKVRRHTWDTSLVGRLTVWMVFFLSMFVVAFLIPYWVIGIHTTDGTNGVAKDRSVPLGEPASPSVQDRMDNIKSVILQNAITSASDLENEQSDAHYALRWITETDPAQIEPLVNYHDNTELLQRYAMAVLYYAAHPTVNADSHSQGDTEQIQHLQEHGESASGSSGGSTNVADIAPAPLEYRLPGESAPLEQNVHLTDHGGLSSPHQPPLTPPTVADDQRVTTHFSLAQRDGEDTSSTRVVKVERDSQPSRRASSNDDSSSGGWLRENRWMTSAAICDWYGIQCETIGPHQVIRQLNLTSNELKGTLPSELQALSHLEALDISNNRLSGEIPRVLWKKLHLRSFVVGRNQIGGSLPEELASLTKAQELDLSFNAFQGTIPAAVAKLHQLRVLSFEGNQLRGTIPSLAELQHLSKTF